MEVVIVEVVSGIRAVDGQTLLSPQVARGLVRLTLDAARDERERERRREEETRIRGASGVLIAAGPRPPAALPLRPDVATRLAWGLVYEVRALTDAEKAVAMNERALERGFELPGEVCEYVLRHGRRDLPSLIAFIDALDRCSLEGRRPVTVPLARELIRSHLFAPRPGMPLRHEQHQPVAPHRDGVEARIGGEIGDHRDVDAVVEEIADQRLAVADGERQPKLRVTPGKIPEHRQHMVRGVGAEPQMPALQAPRRGEELLGFLRQAEDAPRQVEQRRADLGQHELPAAPLDQRDAVALLQRLDLSRQGRLRHPEPGRGAGEAACAGDGVEGAELRRIHRLYL